MIQSSLRLGQRAINLDRALVEFLRDRAGLKKPVIPLFHPAPSGRTT